MKLYLDDVRSAPSDHYAVKTAKAALGALKIQHFDEASLDHDLGDSRMTGLWLLRTAAQHGIELPEMIHLHTQNPVGRLNMARELEAQGYQRLPGSFATFVREAPLADEQTFS